jgi:hypothetical protein
MVICAKTQVCIIDICLHAIKQKMINGSLVVELQHLQPDCRASRTTCRLGHSQLAIIMPTLELPEEAYEYISKKLAAAMTWSIKVSPEKTSLLLVWRQELKKKKKTDKAKSGATTDCKNGKKRRQGASSSPPTTATPGPDLEKTTTRKSSSMRRRDKRRRAAWIDQMKIPVEEKTEEAAPESTASPVADLEVDEMDAASLERTPPPPTRKQGKRWRSRRPGALPPSPTHRHVRPWHHRV